ncbi:MAG TPA: FAD-dependent oxidoreductase [Candidatus Binataceae bacterium]|nr:FAD-dependent oxidoreductase [Candidatus Binataceae bacterium]
MAKFKHLFTPLKIGPVTVKNRLGFAPCCPTWYDNSMNQVFTDQATYYYGERAKGGLGLIIIGAAAVSKSSNYFPIPLTQLYDDQNIIPLSRVADEVHKYGTKLFIQLWHGGLRAAPDYRQNTIFGDSSVEMAAVAPSQLSQVEIPGVVSKALSIEEIETIVEDFGIAASRAQKGGLDGVEIHAAHGYLPWQFMSPLHNKRTDQYGGPMENRARFLIESLKSIRKHCGSGFAVGFRISSDALFPGDLTVDETKQIVKYIDTQVALDFVDVSIATYHSIPMMIAPMGLTEPGYEGPYTAKIKAEIDKPVFAVGSVTNPQIAEEMIASRQGDLILMARQLFADPEFAKKAEEGREEDIRTCVRANYCWTRVTKGVKVECIQNAAVGREKEWGVGTLKPATVKKKVVVIGGGPGGLEAARTAAERGHDVVLYEKQPEVGGRVLFEAKLPTRKEMRGVSDWLERQARAQRVNIITSAEITPANLSSILTKEGAEAVVLATGSSGARDGFNGVFGREIPGWQQSSVCTFEDVMDGKLNGAGKIIILDDVGDERGILSAYMLGSKGRDVKFLTRWAMVAPLTNNLLDLPIHYRHLYGCENVSVHTLTFIKSIGENQATLFNVVNGREWVEEGVGAVVLITMFKSNNELYPLVKAQVKESYLIGDASAPRTIHEAVLEGHRAARAI